MIAASGRFDLAFTCTDSANVPTAPTGTPTGTLVKNGTDLGTTVTVTMTTAQGVASCTIPSDAANGDRFYIRVSAVISGTTYVLSGPVETVQNSVTLPTAPTDWITAAAVKADAVTKIQTGLATASQITALNNLSSLANLFGPSVMEIPDSSSSPFKFTFVVRDNEGKAVDLDGTPTITAYTPGGTDRSVNVSSILHASTGEYTFIYTVSSSATAEALTFKAANTVSGEDRSAFWVSSVVDYNALLTIASIEALAQAIKAKTDNLPSDPADQSAVEAAITSATSGLATQSTLSGLLTSALTESYPSNGGTVTVAQALYVLLAHMEERSISGTTMTIKKRDGSTTAETLTLDSATAPTSITRAT